MLQLHWLSAQSTPSQTLEARWMFCALGGVCSPPESLNTPCAHLAQNRWRPHKSAAFSYFPLSDTDVTTQGPKSQELNFCAQSASFCAELVGDLPWAKMSFSPPRWEVNIGIHWTKGTVWAAETRQRSSICNPQIHRQWALTHLPVTWRRTLTGCACTPQNHNC